MRGVAVLVDFRPTGKLRGSKPVDVTAALGPVVDALAEDSVDLSRVRVVCDWVQYRSNFRDVVDIRPILAAHGHESVLAPVPLAAVVTEDELEVAIDVRRSGDVPLKQLTGELIRARFGDANPSRIHLEPWLPTSASVIWEFNALYWKALDLWEQATGRRYEQALPGGESDARNRGRGPGDHHRACSRCGTRWRPATRCPRSSTSSSSGWATAARRGPGSTSSSSWTREHGRDYYRRLHYLMCDYSRTCSTWPGPTVAEHAEHVSSFVLDATRPRTALGFLRYKVFLVYISNVYDNLPTDEVAQLGGRTYIVQTRAYLTRDAAAEIAAARWRPTRSGTGTDPQAAAARPGPARRGRAGALPVDRDSGGVLAAQPGRRCAWRSGTCRWRAWTSIRSRRRSAGRCCARCWSPAPPSGCTSTTARWPALSTPSRCCTRTAG